MDTSHSEEESSQEGGEEMNTTATAEAPALTRRLVGQTVLPTSEHERIKTGRCPVCGQDVTSATDQMLAELETGADQWCRKHNGATISPEDIEGALFGFMRKCHAGAGAVWHIPVPSQSTRKAPSNGEIPAYKPGSGRFPAVNGY